MREVSHTSGSEATLCVDCGGGGIKSCVLDAAGFQRGDAVRTKVTYPFSPDDLLGIIADHEARLGPSTRITLGMPGMIRGGTVVYTPHYIRRAGPRTRLVPELARAWNGLDLAHQLEVRFDMPALVVNDAEVAAAGVVHGHGLELVLTLGTGLGSAIVADGRLAPHVEISHAPLRWGLTFDDVLGEAERLRLGDAAWSRRVARAIEDLWPVIRWDTLYLGGGNAARISEPVRRKLLDTYGGDEHVIMIPGAAGMRGGARAWSLAAS